MTRKNKRKKRNIKNKRKGGFKRRRQVQAQRLKVEAERIVYVEYYQSAFALFCCELARRCLDDKPHAVRETYWSLVPAGVYEPAKGRELVLAYQKSCESRLEQIISKQSLAYWLHVYRRISPRPINQNEDAVTVLYRRSILEAAFQKYGKHKRCNRIAKSDVIDPSTVFRGLFQSDEFKNEREHIAKVPQLVLTDFGVDEYWEFYILERLAFEMWRCSAQLRGIAKGSLIKVEHDPVVVGELWSDELTSLIHSYDERGEKNSRFYTTDAGVVFDKPHKDDALQRVAIPYYNIENIDISQYSEGLSLLSGPDKSATNFLWGACFNFVSFYEAHKPLSDAFFKRYNVNLESIVCTIASILIKAMQGQMSDMGTFIRYWQRAYAGPVELGAIKEALVPLIDKAKEDLQIDKSVLIDVDASIEFLMLTGKKSSAINLIFPGPFSVLLPCDDSYFLDFAWIGRILQGLFHGVEVLDWNFKGSALENLTRGGRSVLTSKPLTSESGEKRQIDAAFSEGEILVVVECIATSRSLGFEKGEFESIRFIAEKLDNKLAELDERAMWLANHPKGKNYDIRHFRSIVPVLVTPFVEYIPSLDSKYWLDTTTPRIITPLELKELLEEKRFSGYKNNLIQIPS